MITKIEREERKEKSEREGRTVYHVGNIIRIPFWDISVERRGIPKRYKRYIKRRI